MGRQVGFYADQEDYKELLLQAERSGLSAIPELIPTDTEVEGMAPTVFRLPDNQGAFYLIPNEVEIGEAIYAPMDSEPDFDRLNPFGSAAIELTPSRRRGDGLSNGRICLALERDDPFYSKTGKYFNKLARYIRSWASTDRLGFYVGPHTADQARQQAIRLMHHQTELHIE